MTLAIKELMSSKVVPFDHAEYPVCGGRAVVRRLRDGKITLRCRGQSSIVVTRKLDIGKARQDIVKSGMTTELCLMDVFFANGTLSKYQVIDALDGASTRQAKSSTEQSTAPLYPSPSSTAATMLSSTLPSNTLSTIPKAPSKFASRQDKTSMGNSTGPSSPGSTSSSAATVSSPVTKASKDTSTPIDLATEEETGSDGGNTNLLNKSRQVEASPLDTTSDDDDMVPRKRLKTSRNVVLEDSDFQSSQGVESIDEDDVYILKKSDSKEKSVSWMNKYSLDNQTQDKNGWMITKRATKATTDDWMSRKLQPFQNKAKTTTSRGRKERKIPEEHNNSDEEDEQSDGTDDLEHNYGRRTKQSRDDEVSGMLQSCEAIAGALRVSIEKWGNISNDEEVTLTSINDDERMIEQKEIPGLSPSLKLQPYQLVGINWLYLLYQHKVSAVLADEMGLGKTVQTIAFLALVTSKSKQPHLIVVPASVLSNWKREFERFAPSLRVKIFHGSSAERYHIMDTLKPGSFDVILTTYSYFERDGCVDDRKFLRGFRFGYMVLDEGHNIKNANTSRFKRISALKTQYRLVLSGTPIQNNLSELLALLSFLMPTIFNHGSDVLLEFFGGEEKTSCTKIRKILAPFILRRLKKLVLAQMVPKTEFVETMKMKPHQRKVYESIIQAALDRKGGNKISDDNANGKKSRELTRLLGKPVTASRGTKGRNDPTSDSSVFTLLRKAANHPILLRHHFASPETMDIVARHLYKSGEFGTQCSLEMVKTEIEDYSDFDLHQLCAEYSHIPEMASLQLAPETLCDSAKFDYLRVLLPQLKTENHRVLIFSQWTKVLDLLEYLMIHTKNRYTRLDGSTDIESRQTLIDEFNNDPSIFCFLLSTRAGGLGINLTSADTVILHDLDFNPTLDAQATDRCHRIGQTKPVTVYKLVTEDSVDHAIYEIGCKKTLLNDTVLGQLGKKSRDSQSADIQAILTSVLSSYQGKK
ncbi:hypothetical protein LEN26_021386 [Aphanomyces euteiches]|nr:hypothetical protein LEN26_021386 [Aphanomyces euteiches]KAH9121249.1 hypothetical protein AeMF1_006932 [Aphanomyces euteiches]